MDILNDKEVCSLSNKLQEKAAQGGYVVSDLLLEHNGQKLQLVDLVMEGGGTLGIALVGYVYALEKAGIRFLSIGGSSVGAIVSLLLACSRPRTQEKGDLLTEFIAKMDMSSFIDGGFFGNTLSRLLGSGKIKDKKWQIALTGLLCIRTVCKKIGLNPGNQFQNWLAQCLADCDVHTLADAMKVISNIPEGITHRLHKDNYSPPQATLKIVAADITTGSKIVFPEMAALYWENPETINPALFARASMSIPGFFQPMEVTGVANIVNSTENWRDLCSFKGSIPDKITFSDGGLLSNFPISLFHENRVPNVPTLGARLGSNSRVVNEIRTIGAYSRGVLASLRHYSDYDFIYHNPDYRNLITYIPTAGHNWLNFYMDDAEKLTLFKKGMIAAHAFLESFDWLGYKEIRRAKLKYEQASLATTV